MDVLCVGNATLDVFIDLKEGSNGFSYDKFSNQIAFRLGEKIKVDEYVFSLGGNACNVAVGLARLGVQVSLAAEVGSDEFSHKISNTLEKEKVGTTLLKKDGRTTPFFNILLSFMGERSIIEEEKEEDSNLGIEVPPSKLIYLTSMHGNWQQTYNNVLSSAQDAEIAFNPGSSQLENIEKISHVLERTKILFVNLTEAQRIIGREVGDIKIIFEELRKLGPKIIAVTDAMNGSYANDENGEIYQIGVFSTAPAKERTGAGDSYSAGFLYGYLMGKSVPECMQYAGIDSNFAISEIGSQKGLLFKEKLEQIVKENPNFQAHTL